MKTKLEKIECTFGKIYVGNVFDGKDNDMYMKIDEINFRLRCPNASILPANAVNLRDASLVWYEQDELIKCIILTSEE